MNREDMIRMAREAGARTQQEKNCDVEYLFSVEQLERFAELVRADERNIVMNEPLTKAQWQRFEDEIRADEREKYKWDIHSCGPTCKRYACAATREAIAAEREACAKVVDAAKAGEEDWDSNDWNQAVEFCASRIRARSNT